MLVFTYLKDCRVKEVLDLFLHDLDVRTDSNQEEFWKGVRVAISIRKNVLILRAV